LSEIGKPRLRRNLAALASILVPRVDTTEDAARVQAVLDWLKENPGWFLILDNVDTKAALAEVERVLAGISGGHVVVTSRLADFSGIFQPLELGVLAIEDASAFLLARTEGRRRKEADDDSNAREVATELGQLALALEQAAAFIAKRRLTFSQYLEQWRSHAEEVLGWFDETVTGYPSAIAVTWQTSIAQASENGRHLLERLAWLAPEKVPEFLLDVPIPGAKTENLHHALDDLAAYSLVTRDAAGPFFLVHRLVQDVTRRSIRDEKYQRLVEVLEWMNEMFTGDTPDVRNWPRLDPLAPHARAVAVYADDAGILAPAALLMSQLGRLLEAKALHNEAEPLYRRALTIDEESLGPEHLNVAIHLNNLAYLLQDTSRLVEAEEIMRRAIIIFEKNLESNDPRVAIAINNLASLLADTKRFDEAEPLMRQALGIAEENFEPDHPTIAIRLNNLANLLHQTKRYTEAEPLMRRALTIDEKKFGPEHPKVATRLNNLATLLQHTGRAADAEPLIRRALEIDEKNFGPDHPTVAIRLNNLATLLYQTHRLTEAEPLMRRHLAIFLEASRKIGHPHSYLDAAFENYSDLLSRMGLDQAEIAAAIDSLKGSVPPKNS
jgi:tetratricopeptide (TPR) repeat protein